MNAEDIRFIADTLRSIGDAVPPDDKMGHSRMAMLRLTFHDRLRDNPDFDSSRFLRDAKSDGWAYAEHIDSLRGDTVYSENMVKRGFLLPKAGE